MGKRTASARQHHERPSYRGALGPPPASPPSDPLVLLSVRVPTSTKRALKIAAANSGETEMKIAARALRTEVVRVLTEYGLEP
jgi:hypothetical protein